MSDIVIIGGINIDIEGYPYRELKYQDSNPGKISIAYGGVGRNIAENAARLGGSVAMVSAVGNDELGRGAKTHLKGLGVDVSLVREIPDMGSAIYLSILNEKRDMELGMCDMEIIENLTPEFLKENIHVFEEAKAIALDGNLEEEMLAEVTDMLAGKYLFFDPVSANKASRAKHLIGRFHSVKPNLIEAEVLSGIEIKNEQDLRQAGEWFIRQGVKNVYITLNSEGVYYKNREKEGFIKPAKNIEIKSATGAGDAFSAMILTGMAQNMEIDEIVRLGMAAAQLAMESERAVNDKMSFEEIKRRIQKNV